jgi:hypothetical protein
MDRRGWSPSETKPGRRSERGTYAWEVKECKSEFRQVEKSHQYCPLSQS